MNPDLVLWFPSSKFTYLCSDSFIYSESLYMNSCTWIHIFMNSYLHFSNEFIQTINSYDCFLVNSYNNSYIYIYTHIILMNSCINWCKLYVDLKKIQTGRSFKFFSSFRFEGGQTFTYLWSGSRVQVQVKVTVQARACQSCHRRQSKVLNVKSMAEL